MLFAGGATRGASTVAPLTGPIGQVIRSRTGVTQQLWEMRRKLDNSRRDATRFPEGNLPKAPSASSLCIELPLGSDPELRDQYLSWRGSVRLGRLLEDADAFAGTVAFLHCDDALSHTAPQRLVTASIDRIDMRRPVPVEDLAMCGNVTWAGRSSLRVSMSLGPRSKAASSSTSRPMEDPVLTASFVFVAVDEQGKATPVNPLTPTNDAEQARFDAAAAAAQTRRSERSSSLERTAPRSDEAALIHQLLMADGWGDSRTHGDGGAAGSPGIAAAAAAAEAAAAAAAAKASGPAGGEVECSATGPIQLRSTVVTTNTLTQPQERNTAGKVFGGFLCRKAFEVAHSAASLFALRSGVDCVPLLVAADNITFDRPVEVGRLLTFSASVVYTGASADNGDGGPQRADAWPTEGQLCQVRAETTVLDMSSGARSTSNTFQFTFLCSPRQSRSAIAGGASRVPGVDASGIPDASLGAELLAVRPETYPDAMLFLDGRRRLRASVDIGRTIDSSLVPPRA